MGDLGFSDLDLIEFALENDALYELGELVRKADPIAGGRPLSFPGFWYILALIATSACRSTRSAMAFLQHPLIHNHLRAKIADRFPGRPEMHLPEKPMQRYHYTYVAKAYFSNDQLVGAINLLFSKIACAHAREKVGLLDPDGPGTWTKPHPSRAIYGDGKVITPLWKTEPGDTYVDEETGEIKERRYDPDARDHWEGGEEEDGDAHIARGTKFVIMRARGKEPNSRMILGFEWVPEHGREADVAMSCLGRLRPDTPGAQTLCYDRALHGIHKNAILQSHHLIPVIRVPVKRRGRETEHGYIPPVLKDHQVEQKSVRLRDGTWMRLTVHAKGGVVGFTELDEKGRKLIFTPLGKPFRIQPKPSKKSKKWHWYGYYNLPKELGGGGVLTIRLDKTAADEKARPRPFNRTEYVSPIPLDKKDPEVRTLYGIRQDAESGNRALEDRLWIGRAHSCGHTRQLMDLIGFGLMVNSLALHLAARRAPPEKLAA